jgi:endoglucanase
MELLKKLCETAGIAGQEGTIRDLLRAELEPFCDEVRRDALGNLIARRPGRAAWKGRRPVVMLAAHMDEIGFMVSHVDAESGFLRLNPVGGFDPKTLVAQRVTVHAESGPLRGVMGSKPIHILTDEEKSRKPDIKQVFVDLGLPGKRVADLVRIGDMVTLERDLAPIGDAVTGKALDDRAGLYVMVEALRKLGRKKIVADVFAVATVQEEVGIRGAQTSAFGIEPDLAVALDVTIAADVPDAKSHERITKLGEGVAIKLMDGSAISDRTMVKHCCALARDKGIPHQLEVLPHGGTDAGAIQRSRTGVRTITLSVPTRYVHSTVEMAHSRDFEAAIALLVDFLRTAHTIE